MQLFEDIGRYDWQGLYLGVFEAFVIEVPEERSSNEVRAC